LMASHLGVDAQHVHAYVVGEHGDSEVLTWSLITVGGIPLAEYCQHRKIVLDEPTRLDIDRRVRGAAYNIIAGKGHTYYGIGATLGRIVDTVLHDHRAILTLSAPNPEVEGVPDVTLSLPRLVGGTGIQATLPLPLSLDECALLRSSALAIRRATDALEGTAAQ
jgi:L-lactate dehydrogenase